MVRFVSSAGAGVARCAPIGTQLATNPPAAQPVTQLPRNSPPPSHCERSPQPAQHTPQQARNRSATTASRSEGEKLRVSAPTHDAQVLDIFTPELTADPDVYRQWVITIPGRDTFAVIVVPDANIGQMQAVYPQATSIIPDTEG
jgi:hypothetical protein